MASREHHAEIGVQRPGEERDSRRRNYTEPQDVYAGTGQAGHDSSFKELPRGPWVPADHGDRPHAGSARTAAAAEYGCGSYGEVHRELGRQVIARDAADTIRTEQSAHT
jgi:hypothetical protein